METAVQDCTAVLLNISFRSREAAGRLRSYSITNSGNYTKCKFYII